MIERSILASKLHEYRTIYGYTQEHCAELCDISQRYWRKLEHGQATPSIDTVFKLMTGLNVTFEQLFDKDTAITQDPHHLKSMKRNDK